VMVRKRSCPAVSQICNYINSLEKGREKGGRVTYFDLFVVYGDRLHREVDPDGVPVAFLVQSCFKTTHHAGLSHPAVADEHHLEQEVKSLVPHDGHRAGTGRDSGQVRMSTVGRFQN